MLRRDRCVSPGWCKLKYSTRILYPFEKVGVGTVRPNAAQAQCAGQQTNGVAPL